MSRDYNELSSQLQVKKHHALKNWTSMHYIFNFTRDKILRLLLFFSRSKKIVPNRVLPLSSYHFAFSLQQNFQALLKDGEPLKLHPDERVFICSVIVTAEYIIETTQQLETKLKEKVNT